MYESRSVGSTRYAKCTIRGNDEMVEVEVKKSETKTEKMQKIVKEMKKTDLKKKGQSQKARKRKQQGTLT